MKIPLTGFCIWFKTQQRKNEKGFLKDLKSE